MIERFPFSHENLGPAGDRKDPDQVPRELNAIGNNLNPDRRRRRPKAIGLTEAMGHRLPVMEKYGEPIRSIKTPGRANLALYLRDGLEGPEPEWVQHTETWARTEHPGTHPARATLIKDIFHGPSVVVGHAPPITRSGPGSSHDARQEWIELTARIIRGRTHVIWLGDPNGLLDEVVQWLGDEKVATAGTATDAVLVKGFSIDAASTPGVVNRIPMLTDHKKALLGRAVLRSPSRAS